MDKVIEGILLFVGVIVLAALLSALPVMWLWNWLMPELFGITTITFWQALGLVALCNLLFKGSTSTSKK